MYHFIQEQGHYYPVQLLWQTLEFNRNGYYERLKSSTPSPALPTTETDSAQQIKNLLGLHRYRYGTRWLVDQMTDRYISVSRAFVCKVLVADNLKAIQPSSFVPYTTDSRHMLGYSHNPLLDRSRPTGPNEVWVSDIAHILLTTGKWLYLAVWVDLWSRCLVSWYLADTIIRYALVFTILLRTLLGRRPIEGLILHLDRGGPYASKGFRKLLGSRYLQSMSWAGECYDNSTAESYWLQLKAEVVESDVFLSLDDAHAEIGDYMDNYHNLIRKHPSLNYSSPVQFESKHIPQN